MTVYRTILEELREVPVYDCDYVPAEEIEVKVIGAPVWGWLWPKLSSLPERNGVRFPVPANIPISKFSCLLRAAIAQCNQLRDWNWSVRQSKDEKSIIVLKGEERDLLYKRLERQRVAAGPLVDADIGQMAV